MQIGLNAEYYIKKLRLIQNVWSHYFWEIKFCQNRIKFTDEEKVNYIADLLNYFEDTLYLLSEFKEKDNYREALYESVAVLQFMYIQQDLMGELKIVFKLPTGNADKQFVRTLRNELTGHPISRDTKGLVSSVFVTPATNFRILQYERYHRENDFKYSIVTYDWSKIFEAHSNYLEVSFSELQSKTAKILKEYKKTLIEKSSNFSKLNIYNLVKVTEQLIEDYFKQSYLLTKHNILYCFNSIDKHPRYKNAIELFTSSVREFVSDRINDINSTLNDLGFPNTIERVIDKENKSLSENHDDRTLIDYHYYFSKLHNKHQVFNVDYFISQFKDDSEIMEELLNMKMFESNDAEYYSSYEYLGKLLRLRGYRV
jgi:hypothetical protein